jgi:hypothetical protein
MVTQEKHETSYLSIMDAVEALANIADLDLNRNIAIVQPHDITVQDINVTYKTIHWLHHKEAPETIVVIKEIFRAILNYLRNFYRKDYSYVTNSKAVEGIKTIMVLVGEAAKKLDKYSSLFERAHVKSVADLSEYKHLQEFYLSKIARKVDEGTLGKWLLELTKRAWNHSREVKLTSKRAMQTKHVFVDLDSVKKDTEYELFFLRKEDATRFYSPRLIRNIKLVCDFGDYFNKSKTGNDSLEDIALWQDRCYLIAAKDILKTVENRLRRYFKEAMPFKDKELIQNLNKAFMALMLCANTHNQINQAHGKSCKDYFSDFQFYLRSALHTRDYLKLITYPPEPSSKLANCLLDTAHCVCMALFENLHFYQSIEPHLQKMFAEAAEIQSSEHEAAAKTSHALWSSLACENKAMTKLIKTHSNGPLIKVLDVLQNENQLAFDPFILQILPSRVFALSNENKFMNVQIPSPTSQEFIHKVSIVEEFKGFLRNCEKNDFINKHLMINLQDRTSWREHFRCTVLEDLQKIEAFEQHLVVVTLSKDTEFYHQLEPYYQDNHADIFIQHLKEHLGDVNSGFYFPQEITKLLFPNFVEEVIKEIHHVFFSGKNILLREHRLDFIELFYLFLQLKLIEIVKPDSFSLTCKDGVDISSTANAQLFAFLKLINEDHFTAADRVALNNVLYAPALLIRERSVNPERFNRMNSVIKCIESVQSELGHEDFTKMIHDVFGKYYKTSILKSKIMI